MRYDASIGDREENLGGHGTKVACAAAGKFKYDYDNEADGIAQGAKLHIFDVQKSSGKLRYFTFYINEIDKLNSN